MAILGFDKQELIIFFTKPETFEFILDLLHFSYNKVSTGKIAGAKMENGRMTLPLGVGLGIKTFFTFC